MKRIVNKSYSDGQNTPPSCVITMPHNNAYFTQGTDVTIRVYATDLGGTSTGGKVTNVEFFKDNIKLGEASTATSNTYYFLWTSVPSGTYRITAKASDDFKHCLYVSRSHNHSRFCGCKSYRNEFWKRKIHRQSEAQPGQQEPAF